MTRTRIAELLLDLITGQPLEVIKKASLDAYASAFPKQKAHLLYIQLLQQNFASHSANPDLSTLESILDPEIKPSHALATLSLDDLKTPLAKKLLEHGMVDTLEEGYTLVTQTNEAFLSSLSDSSQAPLAQQLSLWALQELIPKVKAIEEHLDRLTVHLQPPHLNVEASIETVLKDNPVYKGLIQRLPTFAALVNHRPMPPQPQGFVGRSELRSEAGSLVLQEFKLHLVGYPGVGKSYLARQIAYDLESNFPLGIAWVDLSDFSQLEDGPTRPAYGFEQIVQSVLQQYVAIGGVTGDSEMLVRELLASSERMLILDNLEDPALLERVLDRLNPHTLLTTGRTHTAHFRNLSVQILTPEDARSLFRHVADEPHANEFTLDEICSKLGNLPLALKIIASTYRMRKSLRPTPLEDLLPALNPPGHLVNSLRLPTDPHHRQSLLTAFDYAYTHLSETEKIAFKAMGFMTPSGASLQSLLWVGSRTSRFYIESDLEALALRSMAEFISSNRMQTHPLLWDFARHQAIQAAEESQFIELLTHLTEDLVKRRRAHPYYLEGSNLEFFDHHYDQALYQLADSRIVRPATDAYEALTFYCLQVGRTREAIAAIKDALSLKIAPDVRAWFLANLGTAYTHLGDLSRGLDYHKQAFQLAVDNNLANLVASQHDQMASVYSQVGQYEEALSHYSDAAQAYINLKDLVGQGRTIGNRANMHAKLGQLGQALRFTKEALKLNKVLGDRWGQAQQEGNLGYLYNQMDPKYFHKTRSHLEASLKIQTELGDQRGRGRSLNNLGILEMRQKHFDIAETLITEALDIAIKTEDRQAEGHRRGTLAELYAARDQHDMAQQEILKARQALRHTGDRRAEALTYRPTIVSRENPLDTIKIRYQKAVELGDYFSKTQALLAMGAFFTTFGGPVISLPCLLTAYALSQQTDFDPLLLVPADSQNPDIPEVESDLTSQILNLIAEAREDLAFTQNITDFAMVLRTEVARGDKKLEEITSYPSTVLSELPPEWVDALMETLDSRDRVSKSESSDASTTPTNKKSP